MVFTKQAIFRQNVPKDQRACPSIQYVYHYHSTMLFLICFLPLHDPLAVHTLILFFPLLNGTVNQMIISKTLAMVRPYFTLHFPLHLKGFWDVQTSLDSWPLVDTI